MARPANATNLNIAQLQRALDDKRSELDKLHRQRAELEKKISVIDRQIERIGGGSVAVGGRRGGGVRPRNAVSLTEAMESVLRAAGKPLSVTEIMEGVLATGYRSGSDKFRGIVNQTLIKEKGFGSVSRGVYDLKSSGKKSKTSEE